MKLYEINEIEKTSGISSAIDRGLRILSHPLKYKTAYRAWASGSLKGTNLEELYRAGKFENVANTIRRQNKVLRKFKRMSNNRLVRPEDLLELNRALGYNYQRYFDTLPLHQQRALLGSAAAVSGYGLSNFINKGKNKNKNKIK